MEIKVKQVSSLEKIRTVGIGNIKDIDKKTLMKGETFSYQIAIESPLHVQLKTEIESPIKEHVTLYNVKNIIMDFPVYTTNKIWVADDDYITKEPGLMPDMLLPSKLDGGEIRLNNEAGALWVCAKIPADFEAGEYPVTVKLSCLDDGEDFEIKKTMTIKVIDAVIPEQKTKFSQFMHVDCIATAHNVEVYSEAHWDLIDKYIGIAADIGINMIYTPLITPPLDTGVGLERKNVQLVKIEKKGDKYEFDFSLLKRWISIADKYNIKYFEMSHLFSQWGLKYAPNIYISENGELKHMFGWHVDAQSAEYKEFLLQFLPTLMDYIKKEGIKDRCYFHISDEPTAPQLAAYKYAYDLVKPLIEDCSTLEALSRFEFYKEGLVSTPVTATNHIEDFLGKGVENQWIYYCCVQCDKVGNRFMSMPSYRNRILGLQMYKYDIKGFLHWGLNFYNSQLSKKKINPYITSSAEKAFPSGDPFSVYPIENDVVPSLRALIFKEALNDVEICRKLESYIGRSKVIEMIDKAAGMEVTFDNYPRNAEYVPNLIEEMEKMIESYSK